MTEAAYDFQSLRVLVVDDSRSMRHIIRSILSALGCREVRESGDAPAAFKEMQNFAADIIVVDWYMEPLDGLEFVLLVRTAKDSRNPFVPIIMLSGFTEYRRVAEARDAGVSEVLTKPVSPRSLMHKLRLAIYRPRPFIISPAYTGPDRRRRKNIKYAGIERSRTLGLHQDDIDALLNG